MTKIPTPSQMASWYHSQILRIPHGNQNPTKRYLSDEQVLELFNGKVIIQEKVDGKLSWDLKYKNEYGRRVFLVEDMTGKHTVHKHIMQYTSLPLNKRIELDSISTDSGRYDVWPYGLKEQTQLEYARMQLSSPTITQIHHILEGFAESPSHFGSPIIEGLVIKNYSKQLFGKWINDEFEDKLHTQ